jgi:hypothetical protein
VQVSRLPEFLLRDLISCCKTSAKLMKILTMIRLDKYHDRQQEQY